MDRCSLIVATYNWPEALELCLLSIKKQSIMPSEIVIADDGSTEKTRELINKLTTEMPAPVVHIWHADEGFRLAAIRNKAIAAASENYIIQIDGDIILHENFIEDHLRLRKNGYFTSGSRVLLNAASTSSLIEKKSINIRKHAAGSKNLFNGLRNRWLSHNMAGWYKKRGQHTYYVKGCNMAFWKDDLLKVNGYNEAFTGWGREDSELAIRLINAGVQKQFIKMSGICYHLHHKEAERHLEARNVLMMEQAISEKTTWAPKGLSQYL